MQPTNPLGWGVLGTAVLIGCVLAVPLVGGGTSGLQSRDPTAPGASSTVPGSAGVARSVGDLDTPVPTAEPSADARRASDLAAARGRPREIRIASLGVRAPVVPLEADGRVLVPPSDPATVGWWRDGALPGSRRGAAVLTGHTVSTGGGVFDDLDRLGKGDRFNVTTSRGPITYVVDQALTIAQRELADRAEALFGADGPGRLVLVTCEDWNGEVYLSNQVVVAEPL